MSQTQSRVYRARCAFGAQNIGGLQMRFWLIAGGCLAALQPALAENAPTGVLVGEIARNGSAQCFLNRGFSTFQRNFNVAVAAGTKAVISFPSAFCQGYELGGVAVLTFSGSNSGTIQFKRASDTTLGRRGPHFPTTLKLMCRTRTRSS
jgi:hypothetical protein